MDAEDKLNDLGDEQKVDTTGLAQETIDSLDDVDWDQVGIDLREEFEEKAATEEVDSDEEETKDFSATSFYNDPSRFTKKLKGEIQDPPGFLDGMEIKKRNKYGVTEEDVSIREAIEKQMQNDGYGGEDEDDDDEDTFDADLEDEDAVDKDSYKHSVDDEDLEEDVRPPVYDEATKATLKTTIEEDNTYATSDSDDEADLAGVRTAGDDEEYDEDEEEEPAKTSTASGQKGDKEKAADLDDTLYSTDAAVQRAKEAFTGGLDASVRSTMVEQAVDDGLVAEEEDDEDTGRGFYDESGKDLDEIFADQAKENKRVIAESKQRAVAEREIADEIEAEATEEFAEILGDKESQQELDQMTARFAADFMKILQEAAENTKKTEAKAKAAKQGEVGDTKEEEGGQSSKQ